MTCDGYSMYTGPGVPDWQMRSACRMISSVWSAYSMLALYFTEFLNSGSCFTNWMRPHHRPATFYGGIEQMNEVGIRNAEYCFDSLSFEELQNAFIDLYSHYR